MIHFYTCIVKYQTMNYKIEGIFFLSFFKCSLWTCSCSSFFSSIKTISFFTILSWINKLNLNINFLKIHKKSCLIISINLFPSSIAPIDSSLFFRRSKVQENRYILVSWKVILVGRSEKKSQERKKSTGSTEKSSDVHLLY